MSTYTAGVKDHWGMNWGEVPAADLAETLGEAMMMFCLSSDGYLDTENVTDMMHQMVQQRGVLKECDSCSRLVEIGEEYCGDDECMED